eukprot:Pgem_evm1s5272
MKLTTIYNTTECTIHIASINETYLTQHKQLTFTEYNIERKDRHTVGGGVAILIHKSLHYERIDLGYSALEYIAIHVLGAAPRKANLQIV